MNESGPPAVLVAGMHRSGTSMLTRLLNLSGLQLGPQADLMPSNASNPKGYWESLRLTAFNERLLASQGGWWAAPPPGDVFEWTGRSRESLPAWEAELHSTFDELFGQTDRSALVKDPRLCSTLPLWRRALDRPLAIVIVHRDPHWVLASLARRDQLTTAHGVALWLRSHRDLLRASLGLPAFVCSYSGLAADPRRVVADIVGWMAELGIDAHLPRESDLGAFAHRARESDQQPPSPGPVSAVPDGGTASAAVRQLSAMITTLQGPWASLPQSVVETDAEPAWVEALLRAHQYPLRVPVNRASSDRGWYSGGLLQASHSGGVASD